MCAWDIATIRRWKPYNRGYPHTPCKPSYPNPVRQPSLRLSARFCGLVGALVHLTLLAPIGIALLVVAGIGQLIRPRSREMYWRGRRIELDDSPSAAHRLYRAVFRE